jgi:hypothetical protein
MAELPNLRIHGNKMTYGDERLMEMLITSAGFESAVLAFSPRNIMSAFNSLVSGMNLSLDSQVTIILSRKVKDSLT